MKKCNGCLGCKNHSIRGIKSRLSNTEKWETKNATFHIQALLVVSIHVNATVVWNTVVKHPMRLKEDMLYASGMLCPHNATHLKKAWKSCQTLHATVVDVYKIDKNCQEDPSFLSIGSERSSQVTWDMAHGQMQRSFWTKHWTIYQTVITDERW